MSFTLESTEPIECTVDLERPVFQFRKNEGLIAKPTPGELPLDSEGDVIYLLRHVLPSLSTFRSTYREILATREVRETKADHPLVQDPNSFHRMCASCNVPYYSCQLPPVESEW
ncbi:hypothetical protein HZC07_01190 [Candidatus Micrarchaeota archaeon]|nr:hypothetical protein [Candidatus Micrarchaeota archaeon]